MQHATKKKVRRLQEWSGFRWFVNMVVRASLPGGGVRALRTVEVVGDGHLFDVRGRDLIDPVLDPACVANHGFLLHMLRRLWPNLMIEADTEGDEPGGWILYNAPAEPGCREDSYPLNLGLAALDALMEAIEEDE